MNYWLQTKIILFENEIFWPYYLFLGLSLKNVNNFEVAIVMNVLLGCVLCLLNTKMVLGDDILMICSEYWNTMMNINNKLMEKFVNTLLNCVSQCLTDRNEKYTKLFVCWRIFSIALNQHKRQWID